LSYYLYVLSSVPTGKRYIGITADVDKRLHEHNSKTGRWTSGFQPWTLLGIEKYGDRAAATLRERFLKSRAGISARRELFERLQQGTIEKKRD
jgi:putative endonuclease